jgi:ligand-binding sensor domain-containing protein/signal transduction histidine kinase
VRQLSEDCGKVVVNTANLLCIPISLPEGVRVCLNKQMLMLMIFQKVKQLVGKYRTVLVLSSLCCLVVCFFSPAALATAFKFESWTSDKGLPQNSVYSILQTRDGYIWFTTLGGLVRYDGVRFTVFDKSNSQGIASNRFTTLHEDKEGNLWVGTEGGQLMRYAGGSFTTYTKDDGLPDAALLAVRKDKEGHLWVFTTGGIVEWQAGRFVKPSSNGLTDGQLSAILSTRRQTGFSFFDGDGLHVFVQGRLKTYTVRDGLSSININAVFEDQHGTFWIETKDAGLNRLKDGKITVFPIQAPSPNDETRMTAAYEDSRGNLWFARRGEGLSLWKDGVLRTYTTADGLSSNEIETIYEDREGNIWLGTFNNGINRITRQVFTVYSERQGLGFKNVYPVYEDRAGNVWIGTWGGDLYRFKEGVFTRYGKERGLTYQAVSALYEDSAGSLWVGTFGGGVNRLVGEKFQAITKKEGLPDDNVRAITQDRMGNMWFGTTNGLAKYKDGKFTIYKTTEGLPNKEIQAITEDRKGNLWVGTLGGIAKLSDGHITSYTEREGLSSNHVRVIHEDGDGVIWVGTYDGGITRFKDGHLLQITARNGLFDNGAFQILEDDNGFFWVSCNRGVYRVSKNELNDFAEGSRPFVTSVHYGKADGFLNTECNGGTQPAGFKARDGRLWFPTQDGVAVADPQDIVKSELSPPVAIEEFMLGNRPVVFQSLAQIPTGTESFEIHYTGLSFTRPEQVRFRYKLEGLDNDWVEAGTRRTAYYSHVPPGAYTFRIMAANSDGVWNTEGASIKINVIPPFWRTSWFFLLTALGFIALAVFFYRRRILQLERGRRAQEAFSRQLIESQESERKRIAGELHDSIGQNLLVIKNRVLMALNITEDVVRSRKQLDEISLAATQSIEEVREIAYNLHPYQLDRLGLTKAIEAMVKKVSDASGLEISISIEPIDEIFSKESEINLFRVVQESLNNIVKHSGATAATVIIQKRFPLVRIEVSDNGKGFVSDSANDASVPGLGLKGIRERVRILDGKCTIKSVQGEGTTIEVVFKPEEQKTNGR